jgi:hypothetical protein
MKKIVTVADVSVTTATTRVRITATPTPCQSITIQANEGNGAAFIYVGDSNVSATRCIAALGAEKAVTIAPSKYGEGGDDLLDLSDYYIDASANAKSAHVSYESRK